MDNMLFSKKFKPVLPFLIISVLISCEITENDPVNPCIFNNPDMEIAFTQVVETGDSILFIREDNSEIIIPGSCIRSYSIDHNKWELSIEYHDKSSMNFPFLGDSLDLDSTNLILDPFDNAPLSALLSFDTPLPRVIKISIESKSEKSADISYIFRDTTTHHDLPVYGLYLDHENTINVEILEKSGEPHLSRILKVKTGDYRFPKAGFMTELENNFSENQKNRLFFIQNCVYDGAGDIRWYSLSPGFKFFPLHNDLIAIQVHQDKFSPRSGPDIRIINFMGETQDTFYVPNRNHHEIVEKTPGGNLLVATNAQPYETIADDTEDMIVEIDRHTGEIIKNWDLREIFDPTRPRIWQENVNDWCHLNSIQYIPEDTSLLISCKLQSLISKINYETGAIKWIFSNPQDWKDPWKKYLLTPINFDDELPEKDYTYAQHMPRLLENGNIMVYDNGGKRPGGQYSRALEFRVDEKEKTVEKIWTYDLPNYASFMGSIHVYDDGSVQIGHGAGNSIYEVTAGGDILFKAKLKTYYRAYPFKLYD